MLKDSKTSAKKRAKTLSSVSLVDSAQLFTLGYFPIGVLTCQ